MSEFAALFMNTVGMYIGMWICDFLKHMHNKFKNFNGIQPKNSI